MNLVQHTPHRQRLDIILAASYVMYTGSNQEDYKAQTRRYVEKVLQIVEAETSYLSYYFKCLSDCGCGCYNQITTNNYNCKIDIQ